MTQAELVGLARQLIAEVTRWREGHEKVSEALAGARVEIQTLKDEIARLKHLPPRPPHKPSGMEKATERPERAAEGEDGKASKRRQPRIRALREFLVEEAARSAAERA